MGKYPGEINVTRSEIMAGFFETNNQENICDECIK